MRVDDARNEESQFIESASSWEVGELLGVKGGGDLRLRGLKDIFGGGNLNDCHFAARVQLLKSQRLLSAGCNLDVVQGEAGKDPFSDDQSISADRHVFERK